MDGSPATGPSPDTSDPVDVLRDALATAVSRSAKLVKQAPGAALAGKRIAAALTETLAPVNAVLAGLETAQPAGTVAMTLGYLRDAVTHLDQGELAAGRTAVLTAHVTLARLTATTTPE